jgi:hypothetical protein
MRWYPPWRVDHIDAAGLQDPLPYPGEYKEGGEEAPEEEE